MLGEVNLTFEEKLLLGKLASGLIDDFDGLAERTLVGVGYAKRVDPGKLEITDAGRAALPFAPNAKRSISELNEGKPRRAHRLVASFEADSREELVWSLRRFADDLDRNQVTVGVSGSSESGSIYSYQHDPNMTHDQYFLDLHAWLEKRDAEMRASAA